MNSLFGAIRTGFLQSKDTLLQAVRNAHKKSGGSTRNRKSQPRAKHRGLKKNDGHIVSAGTMIVRQIHKLRFHPGLNVGFGNDGTLFALEHGRVVVTCEKIDPRFDNSWVVRNYSGRDGATIYKKHVNVIPFPQHNRFVKIDEV